MKKIFIILSLVICLFNISALTKDLSFTNQLIEGKIYRTYEAGNSTEVFNFITSKDTLHHPFISYATFKNSFYSLFKKESNSSLFKYSDQIQDRRISFESHVFTGFSSILSERNGKNYNSFSKGFSLYGNVNEKFYFYAKWIDYIFMGDLNEAEKNSEFFQFWYDKSDEGTYQYIDRLKAKIIYKGDYGDFAIGRGKYEIGENIKGSIILNDETNDYGYFSYNFEWKNFKLDFLHASLVADSINTELPKESYNDKYLSLHNIAWENDHFKIFFGEKTVYGNRSINPSYLLPHTFMRITEHNLHNQDNVFIFGGLELKFTKNTKYYLSIDFDELSKAKLFTDWWGNKYAVQTGLIHKNLNYEAGLQFTAVRPWMYTHKKMINKYSNEKACLGFPEGSNLIDFSMLNRFNLGRFVLESLNSYYLQGSEGADFLANYYTRPDDSTRWLEGEISRVCQSKTSLKINFLGNHNLILSYFLENKDKELYRSEIGIDYQVRY